MGAAEKMKPCGFTVYHNGSDKPIYSDPSAQKVNIKEADNGHSAKENR